AFLNTLRQPPFVGASFAVHTSAAPVAAVTGSWAYLDSRLAAGSVSANEDGVTVARDPGTYVWFADKRTNPVYARPDFYICIGQQSVPLLVQKLAAPTVAARGCTGGIVDRAASADQKFLHYTIAARDPDADPEW